MVDTTRPQTPLRNFESTPWTQDNVVLGDPDLVEFDAHMTVRGINIVENR